MTREMSEGCSFSTKVHFLRQWTREKKKRTVNRESESLQSKGSQSLRVTYYRDSSIFFPEKTSITHHRPIASSLSYPRQGYNVLFAFYFP